MKTPELTGLRGVAASWVVFGHVLGFLALTLPFWLAPISGAGFAVGLFFLLSIVLLMRSLDANPDPRRYFLRRIRRIWPPYIATCLLVFVFLDRSVGRLLLSLAFVSIFVPGGQFQTGQPWTPNYVLWTLQVEEWAYLAFPLIHALTPERKRWLAYSLISFSAIYAALVQGLETAKMPYASLPFLLSNWYDLPFIWLGVYGVGLLVYLGEGRRLWMAVPLVAAMFLVPGLYGSPFEIVLGVPAFGYLVASPPKMLAQPVAVFVGEVSYEMYLLHSLLLSLAGLVGVALTPPVSAVAHWLARPTVRNGASR